MSQVSESLLDELRRLGDQGFCLTGESDLAAYARPERGEAGHALCVLRPKTTDQVSAIVRWCSRRSASLVVQAGNTGLVGDSTPEPNAPAIILSLDCMKTPFVLNRPNRSVKVGAGYRLSEINRKLEPDGFHFPIDLSSDPMAGGLVATNAGGARFLRYGGVRDHVLGLTAVLADEAGSIVQLGRGLRKDNSGPDWKHMFIGAGPYLGIVTECEFDLARLPVERSVALLMPASEQAVDLILDRLETAFGPCLSAFESMSSGAVSHALKHVPGLRSPFQSDIDGHQLLLVEYSREWQAHPGEPSADAVLQACIEAFWEDAHNPIVDAVVGRAEDFWRLRHSLSEGLKAAGPVIAFDLAFTRDRVNPFKAEIRRSYASHFPELELCDFGHVGDGGVHLNFIVRETPLQGLPELRRKLQDWVLDIAVGSYDGTFSAEHGVGRKNQDAYDRFTSAQLRYMSAALKATIAPVQLGGFRPG